MLQLIDDLVVRATPLLIEEIRYRITKDLADVGSGKHAASRMVTSS